MKKLFFILATLLTLGLLTGCEKKDEASVIIGHTYRLYGDDENWETIYFSSSETALLTNCKQGTINTFTHLTYKINKCNVEVYYDYSDFWTETAKGQLLGAFTYMPEQDCLVSSNNEIYYRIN